jgi:antirestriction protein
MKDNTDGPRIYVACLAAYNAGELHGAWIDANQGVEGIREEVETMLRASPEPNAEEWAIHDCDNFGGLKLHEHESLDHVARAAELILEHGEKAGLILDHYGGLGALDEAEEALRDRYLGEYESRETWAEQLLEETGALQQVPESLRSYLDLERYARDLELSGDFIVLEGQGGQKLIVFWSH